MSSLGLLNLCLSLSLSCMWIHSFLLNHEWLQWVILGMRIKQPVLQEHFNGPQLVTEVRVGLPALSKWPCKWRAVCPCNRGCNGKTRQTWGLTELSDSKLLCWRKGKSYSQPRWLSPFPLPSGFLSNVFAGDRRNMWLPKGMEILAPTMAKADEE